MVAEGALIEHACYVGNYYGTPKAYVDQKLTEGFDVILEIEIQGALQVKRSFPDACLVFISTPDAQTLRERLIKRGTESPEVIDSRLARAVEEASGIGFYDYFVINDDLMTCVEQIHGIVTSEHMKTSRNQKLIEHISSDMKKFEKGR